MFISKNVARYFKKRVGHLIDNELGINKCIIQIDKPTNYIFYPLKVFINKHKPKILS